MTTCSTDQCGLGNWTGPRPGDPDSNSVLAATPAFGGIDVSWTLPATNPHAVAYTIIYRGVLNNFNSAIVIANVGGSTYYDKSNGSQAIQYFYWIRFVSINGTQGDLVGPASATANPVIADVIAGLSGKISSGQLATSLRNELDLIEQYRSDYQLESTQRNATFSAFTGLLTQYGANLNQLQVYLNNEIIARQNGQNSLLGSVNTVAMASAENIAAVQTTLQTNINTVDGKVTQIGALYTAKVSVNGLVGGFGIYNDGTEIEAGFEVDRFWIGSNSGNKAKPFIVQNNTVYINQAVIADASIQLAKIDTASVLNLSALSANMGTLTAGKILFNEPGNPMSYLMLDAVTQTLSVFNNGVLRVKIGKLT